MEKKESYRNRLPHFQQPGQAYFVTWNLKNAIPPKALKRYTTKLSELKAQIEFQKAQKGDEKRIAALKTNYYSTQRKYIKAYDDLLNTVQTPTINLFESDHLKIVINALQYWDSEKLYNYAFCVMPNHIHWVFLLYEKDDKQEPVYLQDVLQSTKRYSATSINKLRNKKGNLWQKESFDTTIRDDKHLMRAIEYTLNNPVKAGFASGWVEWPGCWCAAEFQNSF